jgi:integrase
VARHRGYAIPEVRRLDIEFLADEKPKAEPFFFDANTAASIINAAPYPFKLMFMIAGICGLRIGEVTALKVSSIDSLSRRSKPPYLIRPPDETSSGVKKRDRI